MQYEDYAIYLQGDDARIVPFFRLEAASLLVH